MKGENAEANCFIEQQPPQKPTPFEKQAEENYPGVIFNAHWFEANQGRNWNETQSRDVRIRKCDGR